MHWNYRLVKRNGMLGIHEAYYGNNDKVSAVTKDPCRVDMGLDEDDPVKYLRQSLEWMMQAFDRPILDYDQIPEEGAEKL